MNYYNEIDPRAAQWLRNLIEADAIAPGYVDERSIEDVTPNDLNGYTQCHFFAGIAGWAYALDLAEWPRDRPVWTGSCPCQPFSQAGRGAGFADKRHLWPAWQHLIAQCRPPVVFGEQIASKAVDAWIDLVHADMEGMGYIFGCVAFPAASVGAPHIRDRAYWVGYTDGAGSQGHPGHGGAAGRQGSERPTAEAGVSVWMADAKRKRVWTCKPGCSDSATGALQGIDRQRQWIWPHAGAEHDGVAAGQPTTGPTNGRWRAADWLYCRDGKWRPVEPCTFPLAARLPGRVGLLRGYGNAIVPQAASEFVSAYLDVERQTHPRCDCKGHTKDHDRRFVMDNKEDL